jgi:hypothetical protein
MTMKSSEQLLRAWRNGLSLNAALNLFDPKFDRSELAQRRQSHLQTLEIGKRNFERIGWSNLSEDIQKLSRQLFRAATAGAAQISKQTQLIEALEAGHLVALGYAIDRPKAQAPEPVPQFLIQLRYTKFSKSEFSDGEHRYSKVRIVATDELPRVEIGRPSLRSSVLELASVLADRGEINRDTPPKVQVSKIRNLGNFNESTLSDQTIKRHLKSFWKA